jgi:LmbE family N-acetylglucosaminyl deacetylase
LKRALRFAALGVCLAFAARVAAAPPGTELPPPSTGGIALLDPLLQRLTNNRRLLIIGAHPDDENSALLALVSKKLGGEAAYLSLTRGEGGQNLIGDELGVGLGLIRSQELLAARRLDGARQFFSRAYDFGFTRSLEETFRFWPKAVLLEDAVRVVRRFRPQVLYSTFTGTEADGHGQHQASAVIAREALRAAGDSSAFPGASGAAGAWQPKTFLRSNWFGDGGFVLATGEVDPLTGRSYQQVAVASRSLHRSQGTGALQRPGPFETGAIWVSGGAGPGTKDPFDGVDTRLRSLAAEIADASRRARVEALLDGVALAAEKTRAQLSAARISDAVEPLARIVNDLHSARGLVTASDGGASVVLDEKIAAAEQALAAAAEVTLDALSDTETAAGGEKVAVTASVWNAGRRPVSSKTVSLQSPDGWKVPAAGAGRDVSAGKLEDWKFEAELPAGAAPTIPYFLRRPMSGDLYDWSGAPSSVLGEPFQPPPLIAVASVRIAGAPLRLTREVTFRIRDEVAGEIRHAVRAVSKVDLAVEPQGIVWPLERRSARAITVTVTSGSRAAVSGRLEVTAPSGWPRIAPIPFSLGAKGERSVLDVSVSPPASPRPARSRIGIAAVLADGERVEAGVRIIDYEHIRPTPFPRESGVALTAVDLKLPRLSSVGYVRGAADRVPEALEGVGVPIHVLSDAELERGDRSRYDAIVVGSRAYETEPALARANRRLLDYVRGGGLVIVQYQQYPFIDGGYAPARLEIARPHDRVTDETAKVTVLQPTHPIFRSPNPIGEEDWKDWVQERGLYFAHTWDAAYTPLLEMADPGGPPLRGGLLVATVGKGHYVYTGLAFFRQLTAGVPGAYRLFVNLLSWKSSSTSPSASP